MEQLTADHDLEFRGSAATSPLPGASSPLGGRAAPSLTAFYHPYALRSARETEAARMGDSQRTRLLALALLCGVTEAVGVLAFVVVAFTSVSVGDSYWADLFRGFVILGVTIPLLLVPIAIAAVTEVNLRCIERRT